MKKLIVLIIFLIVLVIGLKYNYSKKQVAQVKYISSQNKTIEINELQTAENVNSDIKENTLSENVIAEIIDEAEQFDVSEIQEEKESITKTQQINQDIIKSSEVKEQEEIDSVLIQKQKEDEVIQELEQNIIQENIIVPVVEETKQEEVKQEDEKQEQIKETLKEEKCTSTNHKISVGNSGKWFKTKQEASDYFDKTLKEYDTKIKNKEITFDEYCKKCPYGYESWSCPICKEWTVNFYYR